MGQTDRQTDRPGVRSVCPVGRWQQRRSAGLLQPGRGRRYRSIAAGGAAYRLAIEFAAGAREQQRVAQGRRPSTGSLLEAPTNPQCCNLHALTIVIITKYTRIYIYFYIL